MATTPNMKFWHVTVLDGYATVFQKRCLSVQEANELLKEKKKEYPANTPGHEYSVVKDNF
jgi:hypothetical protein